MDKEWIAGSYHCPHCSKFQPSPPPAPLRRVLVFAIGLEMLLLTIASGGDFQGLLLAGPSAFVLPALLLGAFGLGYLTYLWVSFFLIGILRLPGCEFTAIMHVIGGRATHHCVDTVFNSILDRMEYERGFGVYLFRTGSAHKWIGGLIALTFFLVIVSGHYLSSATSLFAAGLFTVGYLAYDRTVHALSIGRTDLTGQGDYRKLWIELLSGKTG